MEDVLRRVRAGTLSVKEAARRLRLDAVQKASAHVRVDLGREHRTGIPEVVIVEGKQTEDVLTATKALLDARGHVILTRVDRSLRFPSAWKARVQRDEEARAIVVRHAKAPTTRAPKGRVALLTGGASDRRVAAEAHLVARELGADVRVEQDVGVASLKRALDAVAAMTAWDPDVYIVCAGREGALATVVAGLVSAPVIGVPVSAGYGHHGQGESALAAMLQSCVPVAVVNIDAGFVAGALGAQIARRARDGS